MVFLYLAYSMPIRVLKYLIYQAVIKIKKGKKKGRHLLSSKTTFFVTSIENRIKGRDAGVKIDGASLPRK
jgi:hypothetical protein